MRGSHVADGLGGRPFLLRRAASDQPPWHDAMLRSASGAINELMNWQGWTGMLDSDPPQPVRRPET